MEQKEQKQPLSEQELEQVAGGVTGEICSPFGKVVCPLCHRYVMHEFLNEHKAQGCRGHLLPGTPTVVF